MLSEAMHTDWHQGNMARSLIDGDLTEGQVHQFFGGLQADKAD